MKELNLRIPTCWQELTQKQLRYLLFLVSAGYNEDQIKTHALFRLAQVDTVVDRPGMYLVPIENSEYHLTAEQIAEVLPKLDWVCKLPSFPVRLNEVQGKRAQYSAALDALSFDNYQILENLYQGFIHTKQKQLLISMANILYGDVTKLDSTEEVNIYWWWGSFKLYLSMRFPHLFKSSPVEHQEEDLSMVRLNLQNMMDTQLRALTGGDITKNATVLAMDVMSALTELNAKAEDAEEIAKLTKK